MKIIATINHIGPNHGFIYIYYDDDHIEFDLYCPSCEHRQYYKLYDKKYILCYYCKICIIYFKDEEAFSAFQAAVRLMSHSRVATKRFIIDYLFPDQQYFEDKVE